MNEPNYEHMPSSRLILRALVLMVIIVVSFSILTELADRHDAFEEGSAMGDNTTDFGRIAHASKTAWIKMGQAVLFFLLVQWALFPFLSLRDAVLGKGRFSDKGEDVPRAALIAAYPLTLGLTMLAFAIAK